MSVQATAADGRTPGALPASSRTPLYVLPAEPPLRVLLVAPRRMQGWLRRFLDLVAENAWLELVVLPFDGEPPPAPPVAADLRALLAYEGRRKTGLALARATVDACDSTVFEAAIGSDLEGAALRARATALRPELVMLVGAPQWAGTLGEVAQWGCWELDASLTEPAHAALALLGPLRRRESATQLQLRLLSPGHSTLLVESWGATCRVSASDQRERSFLKVPALLMRSLRLLAKGELRVPSRGAARLQLTSGDASPGWAAGVFTFASTLTARVAEWRRASGNIEAWCILLRHGPAPIDPETPDVRQHTFLPAPAPRFWADPSVAVADDGGSFLFVEEWAAGDVKAVISCLELRPPDQVRPLGIALERPFHLSYPQAFQWRGQWYLTVESGQDKCVSLYRANAFPLRWEHLANLVSGWSCVDPTLHRHEGHWYLFANVAESGGSTCDELYLFVAEHLTGPFRPHPANPIVTDVRRARPAGRLFQRDGRLIRPAQDCAPSYGAAVVFNLVQELTPTRYRERPLGRLDASWAPGLDGCHTYNEAGGIEVLDVRNTPSMDRVARVIRRTRSDIVPVDSAQPRPLRTPLPPCTSLQPGPRSPG